MKNIKRASVAVAVMAASAIPLSQAATTTSTMQVTLTVLSTCSVSALPLNFGVASANIDVPVDAETSVQVVCTAGTAYEVGMDAGSGTTANIASRELTNPQDDSVLQYSLFTDQARTDNWGETVGVDTVGGLGDGSPQLIPVYGQVFAPQVASQGEYTDSVVVTLTF